MRKGFESCLPDSKVMAEGLVGRPEETLFDKKGARLIVKLKTKDFGPELSTISSGTVYDPIDFPVAQ